MELFFLRNGERRGDALALIRTLIRETSGVLRIAVAYFNHPELAQAIIERTETGAATRLLINSSDLVRPVEGHVEYEVSEAVIRVVNSSRGFNKLEVRTLGLPSPNYHNMHHKFAVGDDRVVFGSVNWTRAALNLNYEYLASDRNPAVVREFKAEFDDLWEQAHVIEGRGGKLRVIICPVCKRSDSVDFESWGAICTSCQTEFRPKNSKY